MQKTNVTSRSAAGIAARRFLEVIVFVATFAVTIGIHYSDSAEEAETNEAYVKDAGATKHRTLRPEVAQPKPGMTEVRVAAGARVEAVADAFVPRVDVESRVADQVVHSNVPASAPSSNAWVDRFYERPDDGAVVDGDDPGRMISGRVLSKSGRPISGIVVTAESRPYHAAHEGSAAARPRPRNVTTTNANGFYAFHDLDLGIYMIQASAEDAGSTPRIEVRTGVRYADLVFETSLYVRLRGRVTDPAGVALSEVSITPLVKGVPSRGITNLRGRFDLVVSLEEGLDNFAARFDADGFRTHNHQFVKQDWRNEPTHAIHVVMQPMREFAGLSGTVTVGGTQVPGEIVRLYSPALQRNYQTVTDDAGAYGFEMIEPADDYQLWLRPVGPYRDFTKRDLGLTQTGLHHDVILQPLRRDHRISGRITDAQGRLVPNFSLSLRSANATGQALALTSDAHGDFDVENVPEGDLVIESRTMPYYRLSGLRVGGAEAHHDLRVVLDRGKQELRGKVVGEDGKPVANPRVFISSSQAVDGLQMRSSRNTRADSNGRFLFTDLRRGKHTLSVKAPGYESLRLQSIVGSDGGEMIVRLRRS